MINSIIKLFKRYSWFKRVNAKVTYELLAKYIPAKDWEFMNYGYFPKSNDPPLTLGKDSKPPCYSTQMYHFLATKVPIAGKDVVEIGSGRGGGANYIAKHLNPNNYIGIDLAQNAVDLANKNYSLPNLTFLQGSAEAIPLPDQSVDVVLNVESCHSYGSVPLFLNEVKRVLKPGGHFLMVDFRNSQENMLILKNELSASKLELREQEDISTNVVQAIEADDETKRKRIEAFVPKRWQKLFSDFAGVVGSRFHLTLKEGTRTYWRFHLVKVE